MGNRFKLRGTKKIGIQNKIKAAYARYSGSLPASFGFNKDALAAKVVCEGGIYVALELLTEAEKDGDIEMVNHLRDSLFGARRTLNELNIDLSPLEVAANG